MWQNIQNIQIIQICKQHVEYRHTCCEACVPISIKLKIFIEVKIYYLKYIL